MPVQQQPGRIRITHRLRLLPNQTQTQADNQSQADDDNKQPRPPVFITTSLTIPPWQLLEMNYDAGLSSNESVSVYVIDFEHVAAGTYQYKFRIGSGGVGGDNGGSEECWVLDEGAEVGW